MVPSTPPIILPSPLLQPWHPFAAIHAAVSRLSLEEVQAMVDPKAFDEDLHFSDGGSPLMAQYLLVVDSLNFCFWPGEMWGKPGRTRQDQLA